MADFETGDKVRFINDRMKGTIIGRKDKNYFIVLLDDGFEIPVAVNELVLVEKRNQSNKSTLSDKSAATGIAPISAQINKGYYIAIIITEGKTREIHFHLVNHTEFDILFTVFNQAIENKGIAKGEISRGHLLKIATIRDTNLDLWRSLEINILEFDKMIKAVPSAHHFKLKFKETALLKPKTYIPWLSVQGLLLPLEANVTKETHAAKEEPTAPIFIARPEDIIDLHIEKLVNNIAEIPHEGILMMQVNHFINHLEKAIAARKEDIVFIHGLGNGVLKKKIIEYAGNHPDVLKTEEADNKKFGYGATKVMLKMR